MPSMSCSLSNCSSWPRSTTLNLPDSTSNVVIWSAATWASWVLLQANWPGTCWMMNDGTPTFGLSSSLTLGGGEYRPTFSVSLSFDAVSFVPAQPQARTHASPAAARRAARIENDFTGTSIVDVETGAAH